jgi:O-acetyl-ADP-ribose deacetylase (regulator of RNase III)
MIEYIQGNILEADVEALVNPVNCMGVMGAGLALQFKRAYPMNYRRYKKACQEHRVVLGKVFTVAMGVRSPKYIINLPTKFHWSADSQMRYIKLGLYALRWEVVQLSIKSLAMPALGCGLGRLQWSDVRPAIESHLGWWPSVRVIVYEPRHS